MRAVIKPFCRFAGASSETEMQMGLEVSFKGRE